MATPTSFKRTLDNSRHSDILSKTEANYNPVTVIGVGGIGSPTVMCLTKMGVEDVTVYDNDYVEIHNISTQFYRLTRDIGEQKVNAIAQIVAEFNGVQLKTNNYFIGGDDEEDDLDGIVISGVDSMESRRLIWKGVKMNPSISLYIDARMGAEVARIFTINPSSPHHIERYERSINPKKETVDVPCTARAIIYNTFGIASLIANQVKKFCKGERLYEEIQFSFASLDILKKNY